jgi:hypothetical protein
MLVTPRNTPEEFISHDIYLQATMLAKPSNIPKESINYLYVHPFSTSNAVY